MTKTDKQQFLYRWGGVVAAAGVPTDEPLPRMLQVYSSVPLSRPLPLPVRHIDGELIGCLESLDLQARPDRTADLMGTGVIRMTAAQHADLIRTSGGRMTAAADIMEARMTYIDDHGNDGPAMLLMSDWILAAVTVGGDRTCWPDRTGIQIAAEPMSAEEAAGNPLEDLNGPPADEPALP